MDNRAAALELLGEADGTASRVGPDNDHFWTAFDATNVRLHRIHLSVLLGDAGTAVEHARAVDPAAVPLAERRASLFLDLAHAWAQWRKYDRAYRALQAAYDTAPEELTDRPGVRALVRETQINAPPTTRRLATELAERLGISVD